jgi:hypothetical protein
MRMYVHIYIPIHNGSTALASIPDLLKLYQQPIAEHNGPLIGRAAWGARACIHICMAAEF